MPPTLSPLNAALLGLVEGLTEYLPVSSTGHLILVGHWLQLSGESIKAFDVVIQSGAILAVVGLYRRRVGQMVRGALGRDPAGLKLLVHLALAFAPAAAAGVLLESRIKAVLFRPLPVAAALAVGGVAMIALDRVFRRRRTAGGSIEQLGWRSALIIGLVQCLALWPGSSRSLATILGGLAVGLTPVAAAEFSFLLALPTLGAATCYEAARHGGELLTGVGPTSLAVGLIVAAISAGLAIKGFVSWLVHHGFTPFGIYRIILAAVVVFVWSP